MPLPFRDAYREINAAAPDNYVHYNWLLVAEGDIFSRLVKHLAEWISGRDFTAI